MLNLVIKDNADIEYQDGLQPIQTQSVNVKKTSKSKMNSHSYQGLIRNEMDTKAKHNYKVNPYMNNNNTSYSAKNINGNSNSTSKYNSINSEAQ